MPFLRGQLREREPDDENKTWCIAAVYHLTESKEASRIIKNSRIDSSSQILPAGYFESDFLPRDIKIISKILDENNPISLKWFCLLYGNSLKDFRIDAKKLKDILTRLNLHDDKGVVEYSIWALHKSNDGKFSDTEFAPQDITSVSPNVRRWLYRLLTKDIESIFIHYELIESIINSETDISAREGLAIGLGKFASNKLLVPLILRWFEKEKNSLVRIQLLKNIAENVTTSIEYHHKLKLELDNPYDHISKLLVETTLKSIKPLILTQTKFPFQTMKKIEDIQFQVAVSFPGEKRLYVEETVEELSLLISREEIFYDKYFEAQLAKPNLDLVLQKIYQDQTKLIVVFLCDEYDTKEWPGLEWRAIRGLIKKKHYDQIMLMSFGHTNVKGTFSIDGYIDVSKHPPKNAANFIKTRLDTL